MVIRADGIHRCSITINSDRRFVTMEKVCRRCTACGLIDRPYAEQLELKQERLVQLFEGNPVLQPITSAPNPLGYRLTAKLRAAGNPLRLGIYRPGTSEVADLAHCPVQHPLINNIIDALKQLLERYETPVASLDGSAGFLRGVLLRVDPVAERVGIVLVTASRKKYHTREFRRLLGAIGSTLNSLYLIQNYNDTTGNRFLGEREVLHAGRPYHVFRFREREYSLPATAFSQANGEMAARAYEEVLEQAQAGQGRVAELYSGAAIAGLALAEQGREVLAVEIDPACMEAARRSAQEQGLNQFSVLEGDVDTHLEALREYAPETVLVNPPRKGLTPALGQLLRELSCRRLVYMSCNPETLKRDLDELADEFRVVRLQPLDMFPQTEHIEVVAGLERVDE